MLATLTILSHFYIRREAFILTVLVRVRNVKWYINQLQNFSELNTTKVFFIQVTRQGMGVVLFTSVGPRPLLSSSFSIFYGLGLHHWILCMQPAERELRRVQEI